MDYTNFMIAVFLIVLANVFIVSSRALKEKSMKIIFSILAYVSLFFVVIFVYRAFFT